MFELQKEPSCNMRAFRKCTTSSIGSAYFTGRGTNLRNLARLESAGKKNAPSSEKKKAVDDQTWLYTGKKWQWKHVVQQPSFGHVTLLNLSPKCDITIFEKRDSERITNSYIICGVSSKAFSKKSRGTALWLLWQLSRGPGRWRLGTWGGLELLKGHLVNGLYPQLYMENPHLYMGLDD